MKPAKIILYFIYLGVTCLILMEIAVRIWGYSQHYIYDPIYKPCPECKNIPFVHKTCLENAKARGLAVINTDSIGLRSAVSCTKYQPHQPGELRIAITGDSVTFGEGIPETSNTYAAELEKILRQRLGNKVMVFNFGVSAYSVREMAATAACRIPQIEPDIMIMAIIPEDFNLNRTGTVDRWGYTVHTDADGIAGRDSPVKKILRNIHITYLLRDLYYRYHQTKSPEDNVITPSPEAYSYILRFREAAIQNGAKPLLLLIGSLGHRFSEKFKKQLGSDKIIYLDLSDIAEQFSPEKYMASPFDPHPSPAVHQMIARKTAAFIVHQLTASPDYN